MGSRNKPGFGETGSREHMPVNFENQSYSKEIINLHKSSKAGHWKWLLTFSTAIHYISQSIEAPITPTKGAFLRALFKILPFFAPTTASSLLGRLSARFWSMFVGMSSYLRRAFVRSHTDVGQEHPTCNFPSSLSQKRSGFEVGALSRPVTFSHTKLIQPDAGPKGPVSNTRNTTP